MHEPKLWGIGDGTVVKTVLIITDVFPPLAGAGIKRILKFTKFLPAQGWRCLVLTAANEGFLPLDPSLAREVPPGTMVCRTYTLESLFQKKPTSAVDSPAASGQAGSRSSVSLLKRIYLFLGRFLKVPDSRILWLPWAVARGIRLCRRERVDVLLATGPSFTNFLIGAWIKIFTRRPLVLDVRDAWTADPTRLFTKEYLRRLDARCETFVLRRADCVITTNPYVTQDFAQRYAGCSSASYDTIYNGFDKDDFEFSAHTQPIKTGQPFTIVHTGRLYDERTPRFFLQALGQAMKQKEEMRSRMKVLLVGSCETFLDGKRVEDYIREFELGDVVELVGRVSRRRSLEYQVDADLLLLIIGIVPPENALTYGISGKLFDYALCNRPILTLANEGATRELVRESHIGDIFFHEDTAAVSDYLIRAFEHTTAGQSLPGPTAEAISRFDFQALSQRLAQHLNRVATPSAD